jgi:predicted phosphohydrolase
MPVSVQYASDLHLDQLSSYHIQNLIDPKADVLILGGDICHIETAYKHLSFFQYVSTNFQYVLYIPGNHEFYSDTYTMYELAKMIKKFIGVFGNIFYLDNSSIMIEDVLFTGSCLWCNPQNEPPSWFLIDISGDEISNLFHESVNYLNKVSSVNHPKHVIITHYPPISMEYKKRKSRNYDHRYDEYYQNRTIYLPHSPFSWIFGHTHENVCAKINNTNYLSNQRKDKMYNKSAVFFL